MKKTLSSILLISTLTTTGCMKHPSLDDEQRPENWGMLISNTHNFYQISHDVFRSDQPNNQLIPALKQHQIDTVINLRARNEDAQVFNDKSFNLVHIPIYTWAINRDDLLKAMQAIQIEKQKNHKILVHCYHGSDRTGATIAMYRIIFENWSIEDAVKEMKQGGYGYHIIWKNIENIFTPENVKWIRQQLSNPSR
ncbi:dual specificity protein phosphatase family protein [Acinetobacter beijerinckii]|uniref:dual specificity protein phosphatase family protein n=1 Tax=Acinetobacter TaxID=469 RepID=UPI0020C9DCCC|nr:MULTISPECIES: dual specificity protein phosphatase family protein [Acinetobacter]UTO21090.1 dual specificity protein phosphatase family protein [Acinetobacter sp. Z1]